MNNSFRENGSLRSFCYQCFSSVNSAPEKSSKERKEKKISAQASFSQFQQTEDKSRLSMSDTLEKLIKDQNRAEFDLWDDKFASDPTDTY